MLKIFNFIDKFNKKNFSYLRNRHWQSRLDQKLVYRFNQNKIPAWRQFVKLPTVLSVVEKKVLLLLTVLFFISTSWWSWRFYSHNLVLMPAVGGDYAEGLVGFPAYINPIFATSSDVDRDLSSLVFSGLMKRNKEQQLVTDLAENYEISEDQKIYTIKLRSDVVWHDGEKFTADDVVFTIESIKNPLYKSPLSASFSGADIKKVDEHTIKISLQEPYAPFLNILTVGILPKHIWQNIEPVNAALSQYNLSPVGTGAWKFNGAITESESGSLKSVELVRFSDYYGSKPYIDKLIFKFYPDFNLAIEALKNKNVQGLSFIPKKEKDQISNLKYIDFKNLNLPQYAGVFFNQNNNANLKDLEVRKALVLSVDADTIIKEAISSDGQPIFGPILPGYVGYDANLEYYKLNTDEANKVLDDNKWKRVSSEEVVATRKTDYEKNIQEITQQIERKQKDIETLKSKNENSDEAVSALDLLQTQKTETEVKLTNLSKLQDQKFFRQKNNTFLTIKLTTIDRAENKITAGLIKKMWSQIGVEVELDIVDKSVVQKDIIKPRQYEALLFSELVGFDPDPYPFWHSSQSQYPGLNLSIFANKEVDKLLEEARQIIDQQGRHDKYVAFQNILIKEIPAVFIYSPTYTYPLSNKIKGFEVSRISIPTDRFNNIDQWYVKTKGEFSWR